MQLEPKDLYKKLEFDKIIELLENECLGELGKFHIQNLHISNELSVIERNLSEVNEYKMTLEKKDIFPEKNYASLENDLKMLDVEGFVLPVEGLQRINIVLLAVRDMFRFFSQERKEIYPTLYQIMRPIVFDENLQKEITRVIDENGEIRADASPELQKIRRRTQSMQKELDNVFRKIIQDYRSKGWLSDNIESFRNGRRVLSVPAEHKRKVRGIIHDESATGKTTFIEPEGVIDINNDIFDLEQEERREIYKILKELSAVLRPYTSAMRTYEQLIARFDVIQTKARLAVRLKANMPIVKKEPFFGIAKAFHPLLLLKNQQIERKTVPFDLTLHGSNRLLVLSGPNAGGKSVSMKAVGLLQMMMQAGLLIPVAPHSEMGIYNKIYADIGDSQSLEDDLSTYSSRLKNMKAFLDGADERTMVLIDEFGSGTDPKIGGNIAEAILKELNGRQVWGVITTHFSNLKMFAYKTKGILNGCMNFNSDTLSPTYELRVGRPGSSYAFEIAENSGLSAQVLDYAKHRTGANEKAVDELLIDLQREKQELEEKLSGMTEREKKLEKLIKTYEEMHREMEFKRKKMKLDVKEIEIQRSADYSQQLSKLARELREEKNLERTLALAEEKKKEKEVAIQSAQILKKELVAADVFVNPDTLKNGDFIRLRAGGAIGKIAGIDKAKGLATVEMGLMTIKVNMLDLQPVAKEPMKIISVHGIQRDIVENRAKFESKIDLRGIKMIEAMKLLEEFIDRALMSSVNNIEILHGKGDGILKKAVRQKLKEYKSVKNVRHPEMNAGGDGITLVDII